jgi:hypothetical protein
VWEYIYEDLIEPEWKWDYNVYNPRQQQQQEPINSNQARLPSVAAATASRNMLIAQVECGNVVLNEMSSICSRPNRAYARRRGRDYVRYSSPSKKLSRSCFDKVILLSTILEHQYPMGMMRMNSNNINVMDSTNDWIQQQQQPPPRVVYDAVALFPLDAIVTDLDNDLINLLPDDKLLGIAGWEVNSSIKDSSFAHVLLVNLRHKHAYTVVQKWKSMVEPPVTCGAGNDLNLLLRAVESVLEEDQDISSLVISLSKNRKGMIANNAIKCHLEYRRLSKSFS